MGAEPASGQPVALRRNRDFQLLWGGQAVSLLGSQTSKIAYPLLVLAMTGSAAKAGIAGFAAMLGRAHHLRAGAGSGVRRGHGERVLRRGPAGGAADAHPSVPAAAGRLAERGAAERGATGRPGAGRRAVRAVPGRAVRRGRAVLPG